MNILAFLVIKWHQCDIIQFLVIFSSCAFVSVSGDRVCVVKHRELRGGR